MATQYAFGKIVTNGLVLALDAADRNSYVSGSTTWNDLSGNNYSGSLVNGVSYNSSFGGVLNFNGGNQYTSLTYVQPAYGTGTSFAWNLWIIPDAASGTTPIIGNRGGAELIFTKLTFQAFEYYPTSLSYNMTSGVWQNICVVKNGTTLTYYQNGISVASTTSSTTKASAAFYIGGDPVAGEYSTSTISNVQVYNRALSATEILQNYNAQKSRFGLK